MITVQCPTCGRVAYLPGGRCEFCGTTHPELRQGFPEKVPYRQAPPGYGRIPEISEPTPEDMPTLYPLLKGPRLDFYPSEYYDVYTTGDMKRVLFMAYERNDLKAARAAVERQDLLQDILSEAETGFHDMASGLLEGSRKEIRLRYLRQGPTFGR